MRHIEMGVVMSIEPGGRMANVRLPGRTNTQKVPFTNPVNKGDILPVVVVHNDVQRRVGIAPKRQTRKYERAVALLYSPVWAHILCDKSSNPYVIFTAFPTFEDYESVVETDYWPVNYRTLRNIEDVGTWNGDTSNYGGEIVNQHGILSGARVIKKVTNGTETELAIWSTGYFIYCYDLTNEALLWEHTITGLENATVQTGEDSAPNDVNAAPVSSFLPLSDRIAVIVSKLAYTMFPEFSYDCGGMAPTGFPQWAQYDSVKHYLYFLNYSGAFMSQEEIYTESLGGWGTPTTPGEEWGAWEFDVIYLDTWPEPVNGSYYTFPDDPGPEWGEITCPANYTIPDLENPAYTFQPEYETFEDGSEIHREYNNAEAIYYDTNDHFWHGNLNNTDNPIVFRPGCEIPAHVTYRYIIIHYYAMHTDAPEYDTEHVMVNTFSTRSSFSPLYSRMEKGKECLYFNRLGYNDSDVLVDGENMHSPVVAEGMEARYWTYKYNVTDMAFCPNLMEGPTVAGMPLYGTLGSARTLALWDYDDTMDSGLCAIQYHPADKFSVVKFDPYGAAWWIDYPVTSLYTDFMLPFTLDGKNYFFAIRDEWIAAFKVDANGELQGYCSHEEKLPGASMLCSFKSVVGSVIYQHLIVTHGNDWIHLKFDATGVGAMTEIFHNALGETVYAAYADGTYLYLLCDNGSEDTRALKKYDLTGAFLAEGQIGTTEQVVMGGNAFYAVNVNGDSTKQQIRKLI